MKKLEFYAENFEERQTLPQKAVEALLLCA